MTKIHALLTYPPLRLYPLPGGHYALYGSDADVAAPILGLAIDPREWVACVSVPAGQLESAVAALAAAGEAVVIEGRPLAMAA